MRCLRWAILALAVTLNSATVASAGPAIEFDSQTIDFTNGQWSLGFEFTTNGKVVVTHLGFYDDNGDGLSESHDVGIWDASQNLLASTTVTNADPLVGHFRYHPITPIVLNAGETYFTAATTGNENYTWDPNGFVTDPLINFVTDRFTSSTTLVFPIESSGVTGWFGANFLIGELAIPEPGTIGLLGLGLVGMGFYRRRRCVA